MIYLQQDGLIARKDDGQWSITNLGALIAARDISAFPHVRRKGLEDCCFIMEVIAWPRQARLSEDQDMQQASKN